MMKLPYAVLSIILLLAISLPASATTVDEVVAMAEAGVSTEVILAVLDATDSVFRLSADDIVALGEAGVDDEVIIAMIGDSDDEEYPDVEADDMRYLQLTDEQFRMLFLDGEESGQVESAGTPARQPEYYQSPGANFSPAYINTPNFSYSSYNQSYSNAPNYSQTTVNPGWNYVEYSHTYPGTYTYDRKYYSKTGYYKHYGPGYFMVGNTIYYPSNYGYYGPNYYNSYPKYYKTHGYNDRYRYHDSRSKYKVKSHYDDDWYFSLGINF